MSNSNFDSIINCLYNRKGSGVWVKGAHRVAHIFLAASGCVQTQLYDKNSRLVHTSRTGNDLTFKEVKGVVKSIIDAL